MIDCARLVLMQRLVRMLDDYAGLLRARVSHARVHMIGASPSTRKAMEVQFEADRAVLECVERALRRPDALDALFDDLVERGILPTHGDEVDVLLRKYVKTAGGGKRRAEPEKAA